jgi:hypothetical protein
MRLMSAIRSLCLVALVATVPFAAAQQAPVIRSVQIQPGAAVNQIDQYQICRADVERLREKVRKLEEDNAALVLQVRGYREKGGSLVHAYCPAPTTSRTTAGDQQDCAASGYTCEPVSGLCRTSCSVGGDCAVGYTCDTGRCRYTAEGT